MSAITASGLRCRRSHGTHHARHDPAPLIAEQRPPNLTVAEQQVYRRSFPNLTVHEYKRLIEHCAWRDEARGAVLAKAGEPLM